MIEHRKDRDRCSGQCSTNRPSDGPPRRPYHELKKGAKSVNQSNQTFEITNEIVI